ncbi:Target of rapamycin complex 2 subunit bit61 [Pleurostoma richardsiae]|uniref:Target of rapamycin complex 2 subunit bit61 n=1 Tax=Pleurostoma richardsiae TaxID=41990 RepID=A0AA38R433_9PEZI|nr:Target of rapamycin complex 2 subunit bit61 [Pleurostoma richardsiae]
MQPARPPPPRAPGSFSPLPHSNSSSTTDLTRPKVRRLESSSSEDTNSAPPTLNVPKARHHAQSNTFVSAAPIFASFTNLPNSSTSSLQNFSRPTPPPPPSLSTAAAAARSVAASHDRSRNTSPLTLPPSNASFVSTKGHSRKHSLTAGHFEPTLPSTSTSNLSQIPMAQPSPGSHPRELSASQIAAQAAVMHHQKPQPQPLQQPQHGQQLQQHNRQRSQTVPAPGETHDAFAATSKRGSGGPLSPPMLSLTEASAPRDSGFGTQGYHNGLLGNHTAAATTAANMVFPRSPQISPSLPSQSAPPHLPPPPPEKKAEKSSKVKLFSRPGKIGTKGESKDKPLPSPSKIGSALSALQRGNFSTTSLDTTSQSFYSMANSSSATIRALDTPIEKEAKEKKHHFLSRQKHKLRDKDDYHLPLSSASSNSRPVDPNAPSSLYNFNLPPSPAPTAGTFKSMSGLDLRHGGRALRDKKKDDRSEFNEAASIAQSEWPGPSSLGSSLPGQSYLEAVETGKYGLSNMSLDDAWPYLRAKLLVIFEGEDLRLPVEDLNRVVTMHIQFCIQRRSPNIIVEDLRELLATGFSSLDHTLRKTPEDRLIPALVELWLFTFTSILPYMQAVFLPLDQEFAGTGSLMTPEQARDFWGGVLANWSADSGVSNGSTGSVKVSPASSILDVRRLVLTAYRDFVILPRYDTLKKIFSRLSLEFLPMLAGMALASPPLMDQQQQFTQQFSTSPSTESSFSFQQHQQQRPGTAMSLDPSVASYNSSSTTLLGDGFSSGAGGGGSGGRSRAISNVSFASSSDHANSSSSLMRPFTPSSGLQGAGAGGVPPPLLHHAGSSSGHSVAGSLREQNVEDSKQVTEMVGRMLQCMSVLASVGVAGGGGNSGGGDPRGIGGGGVSSEGGSKMVEELSRLLKLNWLGRGRTGRNRRGIVGGRVRRGGEQQPPVREEVSVV